MTDQGTPSPLETWKNNAAGTVVVRKRGQYGVEVEEVVGGGKIVHISAEDRRMNQESAALPSLDVFANGMLHPVKVGSAAEEFAGNSNLMTEENMRDLVKSHPKTFDKRLSEISNPVVVTRLLEIARDEDCTVKRVEAIQARLEDVNPINTIKIHSHAPADANAPIPASTV